MSPAAWVISREKTKFTVSVTSLRERKFLSKVMEAG